MISAKQEKKRDKVKIPCHFLSINEAILIFIVSSEGPFDLVFRSIIRHDADKEDKLFQADDTILIRVETIKQGLKVRWSTHNSKFSDHAEKLSLVQVINFPFFPFLHPRLSMSAISKVQPVKS